VCAQVLGISLPEPSYPDMRQGGVSRVSDIECDRVITFRELLGRNALVFSRLSVTKRLFIRQMVHQNAELFQYLRRNGVDYGDT